MPHNIALVINSTEIKNITECREKEERDGTEKDKDDKDLWEFLRKKPETYKSQQCNVDCYCL